MSESKEIKNESYRIFINTNNDQFGVVNYSINNENSSLIEINAIPNEGCYFMSWNDGDNTNPRTIELNIDNNDNEYIAQFEKYNNTSLKDYYKNIQGLYTNAVNMMSAINQSLTSNSSKVYVNLINNDGEVYTRVQLPSMLYLENKLEELQNNFETLFSITESGEAWFTKSSDMFKLKVVKSSSAPVTPTFKDLDSLKASITDNNFLKDLVSPKTYLKVKVTNLPENAEKMFMKKVIFNDSTLFYQLKDANLKSYEEYKAALYNLKNGVDYTEYDSVIDLPVKKDKFKSNFVIVEIPSETSTGKENPRHENSAKATKLTYDVVVDTLLYTDSEDTSIEYSLMTGDKICLGNTSTVYKVKSVNNQTNTITIEELFGRTTLDTFENNSNMIFQIYNDSYNQYDYVQVPLEENQYIAIFLGVIYNNIRSILSEPILVDLGSIMMYDEFGNAIVDQYGNQLSYIEYYDKYCTNIGDLILGLTQSAYPQLSNFTTDVLYNIQNGDNVKLMVDQSIDTENILQVVPINKHLINNTTSEEIISLHTQKSELNSQLKNIQDNIDNVYNTLVNTDFSKEVEITQQSLQAQLQEYYSKRLTLQKQLNAVIDNINVAAADVTIGIDETKFRIRGVTNPEALENYLDTFAGNDFKIIGLECEYKYKSIMKDTTNVMNINSNLFTDWNRLNNIDRQRKLVFNSSLSSFHTEFVDYGSTQNIIKWNQIDIPITKGEDVIIRIRYKYNVGQPFINIYSPWSDEIVMAFPTEYLDNVEVASILDTNEEDTISAKFRETLINDGYQKHINNALTVNNTTFYHMPENIYSGFNTPENNMINLKDKLSSMSIDIENTKSLVESELNKKYIVLLNYDEGNVELFPGNINKINIYNNDHINDSFVKKHMNIIIKNTGSNNIRFYSIFPGNYDIPLILSNNEFYEKYIQHYERVPITCDGMLTLQSLGQWIYFRQDNPYTGNIIYNDDLAQDLRDYRKLNDDSEKMTFESLNTYIRRNYSQALVGYRKRNEGEIKNIVDVKWIGLDFSAGDGTFNQLSSILSLEETTTEKYSKKGADFFIYEQDYSNNYLTKFEDICGINEAGTAVFLDEQTSIPDFIAKNTVNGITAGTNTFVGAFLYPDILGRTTILTDGKYNSFVELETGKSLSVPITFEYSLDGDLTTEITKAIYFDLRDSYDQEPVHYMLEVTAHYDFSVTGNLINNFGI